MRKPIMDGVIIRGILAQNIKSFREHRKWSQADLAANSDISIPFLSEIERGNKWPYPDTLAKIANALNVTIHELFRENLSSETEYNFASMIVKELLVAQKEAADGVINRYLG